MNRTAANHGGAMSRRIRLSLPALLAIMLAAVIGQAPVASASPGRVLQPARSALATTRGSGPFTMVSRDSMPAASAGSGSFGSALVGSAPVGNGPSVAALDAATHTLYVANGNNANGPNAGGDTISVIDARHCNAQDVSRCQGPWPTITVGNLPAGVAVDAKTDTVYVTDFGDNTVSVFNGATCNALDHSGCGQKPATVPVGVEPLALFDDPASHTVYIGNVGGTTVSMLDSATCNATDLAGCPTTPPPVVDVGATPVGVDVAQATHTVYVTTIGAQAAQNGWAVFDAATCNAAVQSGCGTLGRLAGDPSGPNDAAVDPANDTLYTANFDNTISAFGLRHCSATDLGGCATVKPGIVVPFPNPAFGGPDLFVAVDAALHSVYVTYQKDDSVLVVDTKMCNGSHPAGCATLRPATIHTGANVQGIVLDGQTQTVYAVNQVDNTVSVIDAARCNATGTTGCGHRPPAAAVAQPVGLAADPAAHTAYVAAGPDTVAMISTLTCSARHPGGCANRPASVTVAAAPMAVAVNPATHTAYVASYGSGAAGAVTVLNTSTCNATHTAGCAHLPALQVPGGNPDDIAVNPATGTLYVATITTSGPNLISVFNAATCDATTTTGCGQAPAVLKVGDSAGGNSMLNLAINPATNTIYATNLITQGNQAFTGSTVYVLSGATCDATNRTGCGQAPATIEVPATTTTGSTPVGTAADPATDTIYTADLNGGEVASTVGVINGATCNGTDHTGCGQTPATVPAGFGTQGVAVDTTTGEVYANNIQDTSVSVINGNTCNGHDTTGCHHTPPKIAVADYPGATQGAPKQVGNSSEPIAIDPATCTVYVETIVSVSVIPATCQR
jgi:DNA-binding beta-propeller fold protein YncE